MKFSFLAQAATAALLAFGISTAEAQITIDLTTDTTNGTSALLDALPVEDRAISSINMTPLTVPVVEGIPNGGEQTGTVVPDLTFSIIAATSIDPEAEFNSSGAAFGVNSATPVGGSENASRFDASSEESLTIAFNQDVYILSIQLSAFAEGEMFTVGNVTIEGASPQDNPDDIYTFEPSMTFFAAGEGILLTSPSGQTGVGQAGIEGITISLESPAVVILGDVDMNGVVDFLDIGPFIALLSSGGFQAEGDIDGSGVVDFLDIGPFIGILSGS